MSGPDQRSPGARENGNGNGNGDGDGPSGVVLGPMDFSTHVLSLASSAMVALGQCPAPDGTTLPCDLDTAKTLIDVLGMLEQKTVGNLDDSESRLLQSLLYDLRVAYVDAARQAGHAP